MPRPAVCRTPPARSTSWWCAAWWSTCRSAHRRAQVDEYYRVLAPGGHIAILDTPNRAFPARDPLGGPARSCNGSPRARRIATRAWRAAARSSGGVSYEDFTADGTGWRNASLRDCLPSSGSPVSTTSRSRPATAGDSSARTARTRIRRRALLPLFAAALLGAPLGGPPAVPLPAVSQPSVPQAVIRPSRTVTPARAADVLLPRRHPGLLVRSLGGPGRRWPPRRRAISPLTAHHRGGAPAQRADPRGGLRARAVRDPAPGARARRGTGADWSLDALRRAAAPPPPARRWPSWISAGWPCAAARLPRTCPSASSSTTRAGPAPDPRGGGAGARAGGPAHPLRALLERTCARSAPRT